MLQLHAGQVLEVRLSAHLDTLEGGVEGRHHVGVVWEGLSDGDPADVHGGDTLRQRGILGKKHTDVRRGPSVPVGANRRTDSARSHASGQSEAHHADRQR